MNKVRQVFFQSIVSSWWVVLFFLICFVFYDQSIKATNRELLNLQCRYKSEVMRKESLAFEARDLKDRYDSCQDPSWIEQLLIRELGVVPKGYMKVYFKKEG